MICANGHPRRSDAGRFSGGRAIFGLSLGRATPWVDQLRDLSVGSRWRDVVFVPVSINYDRVLEDYILNADRNPENWRFRADISIISKFLITQFWLWLQGRYIRFGYAAASFGAPVSLPTFH